VQTDLVEMRAEGESLLAAENFGPDAQEYEITMDLRYVGQEHSVTLQVEGEVIDAAEIERIEKAFDAAHERAYGHTMPDPVEVVAVRLAATGRQEPPVLPTQPRREGHTVTARAHRSVVQVDGSRVEYAVYHRDDLAHGDSLSGPAVISEHTGTTVIHQGDLAEVGPYGEIVITVAEGK
jgi:N-methylhydantoinase A